MRILKNINIWIRTKCYMDNYLGSTLGQCEENISAAHSSRLVTAAVGLAPPSWTSHETALSVKAMPLRTAILSSINEPRVPLDSLLPP